MKKAIAVFVIMCVAVAFAENPHITKLIELIDVVVTSPADGDVLTYSATSGKWQNNAPAFSDTAKVVLRYQQENLSGNFAETPFFTASEESLYRLNVVVTTSPRIGDSDPCAGSGPGGGVVRINYNGDMFTRLPAATFTGNGTQEETSGIVRAKAGFTFTLSTTAGICPYSVYVVVEKL